MSNEHLNIINQKEKENGAGIKLSIIDDVTLEFMVNTAQYEKYLRKNHIDFNSGFKRDLRFYRKRIILLTKDLFKSENGNQNGTENQNIDVTMVGAFNMYMRACISYLKFSDQSETIQKCYVCLGIPNENNDVKNQKCICKNNGENDENNINELNQANALCFKPKDVKKITLDNYVIRKNVKKAEPVVYPQQFIFNPKDPSFKYKGLKSKLPIAQAQEQSQVVQTQQPEKLTLLVKEKDNKINANSRENREKNEKDNKIKEKKDKKKKVSFDITNYMNNI